MTNCTVPPLSKVPEPAVTVAVKVIACPKSDGLAEETTNELLVAGFTVSVPFT